jgi:exonuclease III
LNTLQQSGCQILEVWVKIVSWNCCWQKGGFTTEKQDKILNLNPDILVVQECRKEDWERLSYSKRTGCWYGDGLEAAGDPKKDLGVGVVCKENIIITQLSEWENTWSKNSNFRYLIPYRIEGTFEPFTLIAVWTKNKTGAGDPLDYVQKAHAAFDCYKGSGLLDNRVVFIGDFNSNEKWDKDYREGWGHTALVEKLEKEGIKNCAIGNKDDTYYYNHNGNKYQVIDDYCFASKEICSKLKVDGFKVGNPGEWLQYSDHCPIIVTFESL